MNMRAYLSEFTGTTILLATVIGSGIMGETLANGNTAIALLGNTISTGAILYVLITNTKQNNIIKNKLYFFKTNFI